MNIIRMCGSFCTNLIYIPSQVNSQINGKITGIAALQNFASSMLVVAQKAFIAMETTTPRIDYVVTLLSGAHEVLIVPQSITTLADTVRQVEKLSTPKKIRNQTLCKLAYLVTALFSQTVRLLQFIDSHGGSTLATCIHYDQQHLGGLVARVGSSRVFNGLGIGTLEGFKNKMAILSSLLVIAHAVISFNRIAPEERPLTEFDPKNEKWITYLNSYKARKFEAQRRQKSLIIANELCKIASICCFGKTGWPVSCFNVVSSFIEVSKESYRAYHIGSRRPEYEDLPTLHFV